MSGAFILQNFNDDCSFISEYDEHPKESLNKSHDKIVSNSMDDDNRDCQNEQKQTITQNDEVYI